ncbi:MAG: hypothetical protein H6767_09565 [Candidatus Peribacteria bacterium]|nr:MAG: hypothetical protein H6767_09565 [Candidatus Peribacteria bacterium]
MIGITIVGIFTVFSLLNSALLSLMQAKMQMEFSSLSTISGKLVNLIGILVIVFVCLQSGSIDSF